MVSQVLAQAILNQKAPDILGKFQEGQQIAKKQHTEELVGKILQGEDRLSELAGINPEVALSLGEQIRARNAQDINDFVRDAKITEGMLLANDPQRAQQFLSQRFDAIQRRGGDTTQTGAILNDISSGNTQGALDKVRAFTGAWENSKEKPSAIVEQEMLIQQTKSKDPVVARAARIALKLEAPADTKLSPQEQIELAREKALAVAGVEADTAGKIEEIKALGKKRSEIKSDIFNTARDGVKTLNEVSTLRRALSAVKTGRLAVAQQAAGALIPGLRDADAEALNSAINEFVLRRKDELLGGGILSDADIALLQGIGPQLGNTPEANINILDRFERVARNSIDRGKRLRSYKGDVLEFDIDIPPVDSTKSIDKPSASQKKEIKFLGFE